MRPSLTIAIALFLGLGCTSPKEIEVMQEQSVGQIPCPSEKIEIIQYKLNQSDGSGYWMALCGGSTYKCTRGSSEQTSTINPRVTCEMMESQMPE